MIEIETLEVAGIIPAMKALRLPYGLPARSKSVNFYQEKNIYDEESSDIIEICSDHVDIICKDDIKLANRLVKAGDPHAKTMRGIIAYTQIIAPIYWWRELETYRHGHERLSCSSTMHIQCKGLKGAELQKAKAEIPMGHEQVAVDFFSYQCLRNIYRWRKNHRLPEWQEFCEWIETLPLAEELILPGLKDSDIVSAS